MSVTIRCKPSADPGGLPVMPIPTLIEHAEPFGVICTTRKCSPAWWSTSSRNPQRST